MFIQQTPIDPTLPAAVDPADLTNWPAMLDQILGNLLTPAAPPLLGLGNALWTGLASIVVVWTGLRIAFSGGSFNFWDAVRLIIGLSIPLGMLRFYAVDVPGVGLPFPAIIPAGANQITDLLRSDIITEMNASTLRLSEAFTQNLAAGTAEGGGIFDVAGAIQAWLENKIMTIIGWVGQLVLLLAFIGIYAISMAQVFWAQIAIAILIFLGPAFIPWLVFEPLSFLFWGWFRAMWTYSLYAIIATALMRVWCTLSLTLLESLVADNLSYTDVLGGGINVHFVAIVPLFAAAVMSASKVSELAGAIAGASPSGGGMGAITSTAISAAAAKFGGRFTKLAGGMK